MPPKASKNKKPKSRSQSKESVGRQDQPGAYNPNTITNAADNPMDSDDDEDVHFDQSERRKLAEEMKKEEEGISAMQQHLNRI